jgi:DNA-binding transcriptional ArsR family regulator
MVTNSNQLDRTFHALADPTRRAILARLSQGEATVGELARPFDVSRPAISKHLRVLEAARLVQRTRDGRLSRCGLDAAPMREAADWVERYRQFWEDQLDSLSRYLEDEKTKDEKSEQRGKHKKGGKR